MFFFSGGAVEFEAFAVGKWNGMEFSRPDLEQIAENFTALAEVHKVPLKFGHNDKQPMTDGQPALGWVTKAWVDDDSGKLMLRAEHVPKIVQDAMKNKLYRKVSIELDIGVEHKGKKYAYVLSGVALLGADLPAVNTLKDLDHYISGESRLAASRRAEFSAIDGLGKHETKEFTMDEKKLQEMMDASIAKAVEPLKNQLAEKDSQLAKFTRDEEARASAEKATKIKTARDSAKAILEEGVKLGAITPGQREMFTKTLGIEDDAKVVLIEPEDLRKLIGAASSKFSKDESRQASEKVERKFPDDPGAELDYRVREALSKDSKLSYSTAYQHELRRDPELAREHANS